MPLDELELTGRSWAHVVEVDEPRCILHRGAVEAFVALRVAAVRDGIDIAPVSSWRDFERQALIWNEKFRGERPLYDRTGSLLDRAALTEESLVDAILIWSALPGASRHHWGSDFDVIDRAALPEGYRPQLLPHEFAPGGVFARLELWMQAHLHEFGFFRPYSTDRGGVQPEPWHLSYAPVAVPALEAMTPQVLRRAIEESRIEGRELVLARLEALHALYVAQVDAPPRTISEPTRLA